MDNDTISRKDAIDIAMRYCPDDDGSCSKGDMDIRELLDDLENLPSVQQWIPCSERLPKEKINPNTLDFEKVLCSTTFGDVRAYKFGTPLGWKEPHFWNGPGIMDEYVVAWMPLPEPYGRR